MIVSAISDVHVKSPHDDADRLLCKFLDHPKVQKSDYVLLLGDIFDLMCGPHEEYLQAYDHIFKRIDQLVKNGKKVYFFEGNHDIHLSKLFKKFWEVEEVKPSRVPVIEMIDGKSYYFSHGDEHEVDNLSYQRYMKFITSKPLTFVANYLMPYSVLNFFGERASKVSRKKGSKAFNEELVKERFRKGVAVSTEGKYDFVIGGHSHVKDLFQIPDSKETYLNNGYALKTKSFIYIENHQPSFESLV